MKINKSSKKMEEIIKTNRKKKNIILAILEQFFLEINKKNYFRLLRLDLETILIHANNINKQIVWW